VYFNFRLWTLTEGVRGRIAAAVLMGLGAAILGMARLVLLGWLLGLIFSGVTGAELWWPALAIAGVIALRGIWDYARIMTAHGTAAKVQKTIREKLFDRIIELGPARFAHSRTGEVITAAVEGVEQLEIYFSKYLPQFFVAALTPLVIFVFVAALDWPVALVLLGAALFTLFAPTAFHIKDEHNSRARARAYRDFASEFLDCLQGLATLKAFGQSAARGDRLDHKAQVLFRSTMSVLATNTLSRGITDTGIAVGAAAALGLGAWRYTQGLLSLEVLLMILMLGVEVFRPLRDLRSLLHDGMLAQSAAEQIFRILEDQPLVKDTATAISCAATLAPTIRFRQVDFSYPGARKPVHSGLDFEIRAGERVGIVGTSGSGKSSIVWLLERFYDPQHGRIEIGGQDIAQLPLNELRRHLALVSQDPWLFHGSIRDNLLFGNPRASDAALYEAARSANAHDFISALPQGYQSLVGERGVRLSGGQRQRLAIARALLRDAPVLILDEALSSVDAENEAVIQQALDRLMAGRTTLILAHRLSSIIGTQRILVMDQGRICEQGSHQELLQRGGHYRQLMAAQVSDRQLHPQMIPATATLDHGPAVAGARSGSETSPPEDEMILTAEGPGWLATLARLFGLIAPWKGRLALTFSLGVARVSAFIGVSVLSALAFAAVKNGDAYAPLLIGLSVLAASAGVLHWLESWVAHDMAFRLLAQMRIDLYRKLDSLAPAFLFRRHSGDLINLATHDVELVEYFFAHTVAPAFVAIVVPAAVLILLASFHWVLALALFPFLMVVALAPVLLRRRIDWLASRAREVLGAMSAHSVETLQGLAEVLSSQGAARRRREFVQLIGQHQRVRLPFFRELTWQTLLTETATGFGALAVILTAAALIGNGTMDADYLPLLTLAAMAAFLPVSEIADAGRQLADTLGATRRLARVHEEPVLIQDGPGAPALPVHQPLAIRFENLSFTYPGRREPALQGVSVKLPAGRTTALVGPSGAGKSTLAHLLIRFWDPQSGRILLDGTDLRTHSLAQLHERISLVAQDTYLFNESLRENLLIARPGASDEQLHNAVEQAELSAFVEALPEGLETRVGERGYALSGGQRQRVSIARAFLRDAPGLILDEATSHLDTLSEHAVHRALKALMARRTTLIIAHRLATVRAADQIIVLDNGCIIEQGSHTQLLSQNGLYRHLIARQMTAGDRPEAAGPDPANFDRQGFSSLLPEAP